jgi:hypothetical protein
VLGADKGGNKLKVPEISVWWDDLKGSNLELPNVIPGVGFVTAVREFMVLVILKPLLVGEGAPKGFVTAVIPTDPNAIEELLLLAPNTEVLVLLIGVVPNVVGFACLFSPKIPFFVVRKLKSDVAGLLSLDALLPMVGTPEEGFAAGTPSALPLVLAPELDGRPMAKTLFPPSEVTRPRILTFRYPTPNLFISVSSAPLSFCFFSTPMIALGAKSSASPTLSLTI